MDATLTLVVTLLLVGTVLLLWARRSAGKRPRPPSRRVAPPPRRRPAPSDAEAPPAPLPPPMSEIPRSGPRRRPRVPSPVGHGGGAHPPVGEPPDETPRTWAERFDLPPSAAGLVRDRDDPVDIVRAILEAAGRPVEVEDDIVRSGEHFVALLGARTGRPVMPKALSDLYLRFRASGATDGVVICLRHLDPVDVRRRELLAPELRHEGVHAIQAMADAVARGEDPLVAGLLLTE